MMTAHFFTASSIPLEEGGSESIIHLAKVGTHDAKRFTWTPKKFQELIQNFKANAYGNVLGGSPVLAVNYGHNREGEAAGWITDVFISSDEQDLFAKVSWTASGAQAVRDKRYLYASAEWFVDYIPDGQEKSVGLVLAGAGLVIDPAVKGLEVLTAKKQNKKKDNNSMAKYEEAAVANITLEDVMSWLASATPEEKMKICELAGGVMKPPGEAPEMESSNMPDKKAMDMKEEEKAGMLPKEEKASSQRERVLEAALQAAQNKLVVTERQAKFAELFAAGKVVEAQKKAFLDGDMLAFIENAVPLHTASIGSKTNRVQASVEELDETDIKAAQLNGMGLDEFRKYKNLK